MLLIHKHIRIQTWFQALTSHIFRKYSLLLGNRLDTFNPYNFKGVYIIGLREIIMFLDGT